MHAGGVSNGISQLQPVQCHGSGINIQYIES